MDAEKPAMNTDRELWREPPGDYYADSIHLTEKGGIGINVGGHVIVRTLEQWHAALNQPNERALAAPPSETPPGARVDEGRPQRHGRADAGRHTDGGEHPAAPARRAGSKRAPPGLGAHSAHQKRAQSRSVGDSRWAAAGEFVVNCECPCREQIDGGRVPYTLGHQPYREAICT